MKTVHSTRAWPLFQQVFRHEARLLWADRSLWAVCGLVALLLGYSLFNGVTDIAVRERVVSAIPAQQAQRDAANAALLSRVMAGQEKPDPFANPVDPASMGSGMGAPTVVMPYLALAPLAIGQSDMQPNYYRVTFGSKNRFLYDAELKNPWNLLSGSFDLAFVLVYLLPLAVLALSWNLLSAEREQGSLRLLLSQPLSLLTLVAGKVALRAAALLGTVVVVVPLVLLALQPAARSGPALLTLAAALLLVIGYGLFWLALALVVNALGRSSAFNALVLMASWVLLILVLPVVLNLAVQLASPAPSRTELATRTRLITTEGLNRYNKLLSADYRYIDQPQVLLPKDGKIEVAPRLRAFYLMGRDTDREIDGLLQRFDEQLAGQQALVERWAWLSPAIVLQEGLSALAGTGGVRYQHFKQQVEGFHAEWKAFFEPRLLSGTAITPDDLPRFPRFTWVEQPAAQQWAGVLRAGGQLWLPALLLALLACWRLRRYRVVA